MSHRRDLFSRVTRQFPHHLSWVMKWPAAAWHLAPSLSSASAWSTSRKPCVPTDPPIVCAYVVCHARRGGPAHFPSVKKRGRGRLSFLCSSLLFFSEPITKEAPITPTERQTLQGRRRSSHSCCRNVLSLFFFGLVFQEGGEEGVWWHHHVSHPGRDKQLWSNRASLFHRFSPPATVRRAVQRSSLRWCISLSHPPERICWCPRGCSWCSGLFISK